MIAWLRGKVVMRDDDALIVDAGGVGWRVVCYGATLEGARPDTETEMFVEQASAGRDEPMRMFGFATLADRQWFRALTKVQGVGARAAMAMLAAAGGGRGIAAALREGRESVLRQATGVGAKLARRVATELRAQAEGADDTGARLESAASPATPAREATEALRKLGFSDVEAARGVRAGLGALGVEAAEADVAELVRAALRSLGPGR